MRTLPPLDAVPRSLPDVLIVADHSRRVALWNPAAATLLGLSESEAIGQRLDELPIPEANLWLPLINRVGERGAPQRSPAVRVGHHDAAPCHLEFSVASLRSAEGAEHGVVIVGHDVTEQVHLHAAAEARVAELTRQIERHERFLSAVSHDLRTPVTALIGYSELLLDGIVGDLEPAQHDMVERMAQVSADLARMLEVLLDLTRLNTGRMVFHPETITLLPLVHRVLAEAEPQAYGKELHVDVGRDAGVPDAVFADPARVQQILMNLLSNAIKFTERGKVRVGVCRSGDFVCVSVQDTGPGLPPGGEATVFEEFTELASGRGGKKDPGSGLGLAVSRRLARAMGGELTAENVPDGGATFTLFLPAATDRPEHPRR